MAKTITLRVEDSVYAMLKTAAIGEKRSISNFIEYAAVAYLSAASYASEEEMNEILKDKKLVKSINQARKEIKQGKFKIV